MPTFCNLCNLVVKWLPVPVGDYLALEWRMPRPQPGGNVIKSYQEDMDIGEMFLNYMMHHKKRHAFGA